MVRLDSKPQRDAVAHIKQTARRLFAERGVDGVTVREIAMAAGQKNHAAVGYHFGSKEGLVREIILDGAIVIDERRNKMLDGIESQGGPRTVCEIVDVLIYPSIGLGGGDVVQDNYISFIVMLGMTHRDLFMDALANRWNSGYLRCLGHLRRLMPDMPPAAKNQRLVFMGAYLGSVLAMRERALADTNRPHPTWSAKQTLRHLSLTIAAILQAPLDDDIRNAFIGIPSPEGKEASTAVLGPIE